MSQSSFPNGIIVVGRNGRGEQFNQSIGLSFDGQNNLYVVEQWESWSTKIRCKLKKKLLKRQIEKEDKRFLECRNVCNKMQIDLSMLKRREKRYFIDFFKYSFYHRINNDYLNDITSEIFLEE